MRQIQIYWGFQKRIQTRWNHWASPQEDERFQMAYPFLRGEKLLLWRRANHPDAGQSQADLWWRNLHNTYCSSIFPSSIPCDRSTWNTGDHQWRCFIFMQWKIRSSWNRWGTCVCLILFCVSHQKNHGQTGHEGIPCRMPGSEQRQKNFYGDHLTLDYLISFMN